MRKSSTFIYWVALKIFLRATDGSNFERLENLIYDDCSFFHALVGEIKASRQQNDFEHGNSHASIEYLWTLGGRLQASA